MKRTLALILTVLMLVSMIPATLLSVIARGPGVAADTTLNQSTENSPNQFIPETVVIDGVLDDTAWLYSDWNVVNTDSGTWSVQNPSEVQADVTYKYQLKIDYYYLYGAIVIDKDSLSTGSFGAATIWFNDGTVASACTDKFVIDFDAKTITRTDFDGETIEDKSPYAYEQSCADFVIEDDKALVEFKCLLADFCPTKNPDLKYFISLAVNDGNTTESLYHPMIAIEDTFDRDSYFPSLTNWPDGANVVSKEHLNSATLSSFIEIDGKVDEAIWATQTDFYSKWFERMGLASYIENEKPFANITTPVIAYDETTLCGAKYDLHVSDTSFYGAAIIEDGDGSYSGTYCDTLVQFKLIRNVQQDYVIINLRYDALSTTYTYATVTYYSADGTGVTIYSDYSGAVTDKFAWKALPSGGYNQYTFEFELKRTAFGNGFVPDEYEFTIDADPAKVFAGTFSDTYQTAAAAKPFYMKNTLGTYYNTRGVNTEYTIDANLGQRAWPGLAYTASPLLNSDLVGTDFTRLQGVNYMPQLRSDLNYVYGSILIEVPDGFTWQNGTASEPNGGDCYKLWTYDGTNLLSYGIWTDNSGNAVIGTYSDGAYAPDTTGGMVAAIKHYDNKVRDFVNGDNTPGSETNDYYVIEFRIPHNSLGITLDVNELDLFSEKEATAENENVVLYYSHGLTLGSGTMHFPSFEATLTAEPTTDTFETDCAQKLNKHDVIYENDPDGKIIENQRLNMEKVDYSNSEYRVNTKDGNYFNYYYNVFGANRYTYFNVYIDNELTEDTKVIIWLKKLEGTEEDIYKYEFYNNGSDVLAINGTVGTPDLHKFGFKSENSKTTFETAIYTGSFGGENGFEYFIEVVQTVGDETLSRVTPKVEEFGVVSSWGSHFLSGASWLNFAGTVPSLVHFSPEEIEIDGNLNDNGWLPGNWIKVTTDVNACIQETTYGGYDCDESEFYYQMRMDEEYLYVAAIVYFTDGDSNNDAGNKNQTYKPTFRLWVKNGKNGDYSKAASANTYTKMFDLTYNSDPEKTGLMVIENIYNSYPNNVKPLYNKYYTPVTPVIEDGKYVETSPGSGTYQFTLGKSESDVFNDHVYLVYGESDFFGLTEVIVNDDDAIIVDAATGQTKGENIDTGAIINKINALRTQGEKEVNAGTLTDADYYVNQWKETTEVSFTHDTGIEAGVMTDGGGKSVNGYAETLADNTAVVEFKISLDEIGGGEDFQYYIQSETYTTWAGGHVTTMYPAIVSEPGSASNYFHFNYPFWKWTDNTSITVNEAMREAMALRTYKKPVITLGAKVSETYTFKNEEVNAIRFGGMWTEEYIRKVNKLDETDGYTINGQEDKEIPVIDDVVTEGNYTDYWDVKAMGMVFMPTHLVQYNKYENDPDHTGRYDLFIDTTVDLGNGNIARSAWLDADGIVNWPGYNDAGQPALNFADYENFAFYITLAGVPENALDMNFCFRGFVEYYDSPSGATNYYDVILERSINMVTDASTNSTGEDWEENVALEPGAFEDNHYYPNSGTTGTDKKNNKEDEEEEVITPAPAPSEDTLTIAYVPLDNRPVNVDRVEYLAGSAGFDIRMPDAADYTTIMDGNVAKDNSLTNSGGNPENILKWLKSQEAAGIDYYVISLDQMLSGGLVTSRRETEIDALDYEIADYIIELTSDPDNHVVLNDTVMRLAPETDFGGFSLDVYNALRDYGAKERLELSGLDLTVDNIIASYTKGTDGSTIEYDSAYEEAVQQHLAARARKLRLIDYIINGVGNTADHLFIAVDDSSSETNIQRNDRAYIKALAESKGIEYTMFAGTDEIGMLGVAAIAGDVYLDSTVNVNVEYFGTGENRDPADSYDYQSLDETINGHLAALGAVNTGNRDANTLQILVLTYEGATDEHGNLTGSPKTEAIKASAEALFERLQSNIAAGYPTCVIDASNVNAGNAGILSEVLLGTDAWYTTTQSNRPPFETTVTPAEGYAITNLLSYSCWNTIGNTIGIGLSNAVGRFSYLYGNSEEVTHESNLAFLKGFTFAIIKDQTYRQNVSVDGTTTGYGYNESGYFDLESTELYDDAASIIEKLNWSEDTRTILGKNGDILVYDAISISNVSWPWERAFECRFDVTVEMTEDQWQPDVYDVGFVNNSDNSNTYDEDEGTIRLWASEEYASPTGFTWWSKALLEYDDNLGTYKVIAVSVAGDESHTTWEYGGNKIIIAAFGDYYAAGATFISGLTEGTRLKLVGATLENLKTADASTIEGLTIQTVRN